MSAARSHVRLVEQDPEHPDVDVPISDLDRAYIDGEMDGYLRGFGWGAACGCLLGAVLVYVGLMSGFLGWFQ